MLSRAGGIETIGGRSIPEFAGVSGVWPRGARLEVIRGAAAAYRERFLRQGEVQAAASQPLSAASYPTRYAFNGTALAPTVPYVRLVNRMLIVQYEDFGGAVRTLLWEPTIPGASNEAPFYAQLEARVSRLPGGRFLAHNVLGRGYGSLDAALGRIGLHRADVDYVCFDQLHAQDVRRLVGTTDPWADHLDPRAALFPGAKVIVQRRELGTFESTHPMQWAWYVDGGMDDVVEESIVVIDDDVELGVGISLISTPGHTAGNQSLAINTPDGIWVSSQNGVSLDNWQPQRSKIPGVRAHAELFNREVVLNANMVEDSLDQYDSMVKEKTLASPFREDPSWLQILPSAELAASRRSWPVLPTHVYEGIEYGRIFRRLN